MTKRFLLLSVFCVCLWLACKLEPTIDPDGDCPTLPVANFSVDKNSGNAPLTVAFTNNSSDATTYQWDFQSGSNSTDAQPGARQFATAGNYTVKLIATAKAGCSDTFSLVIMVVDPLAPVQACAQVTGSTNNGTAPSVVSFSAACSANATSFAWDFGDPNSGGSNTATGLTANHAYATQGTYNVKMVATGPAGSKDTTLVVLVAQAATPPIAGFAIANGGCNSPCYVIFTNISTDATSFEWDFGDGTPIVTQVNPTHQYELQGDFIVTLTAIGPGGTDTETKTVKINPLTFKKTFGESGDEYGYSVQQTADGGYILLGEKKGDGMYLIKTDKTGEKMWEKTHGLSNYSDIGSAVEQIPGGGYALLGSSSDDLGGGSHVSLIRVDNLGNSLGINPYGNPNSIGYSLQKTSDGGFILLGATNAEGQGSWDMFLIKTNNIGDLVWKKTFGGVNSEDGVGVQQTADGGFILVGSTGIGLGTSDVYVIKTESNGDTVWTKTFGSTKDDYGYAVTQTPDGGFVIAGNLHGVGGNYYAYLIKTDNAGTALWQKTYDAGPNYEIARAVILTSDGGFALLGSTNSIGAGADDMYLIKTEGNGNKIWEKTFGGTGYDFGYSLQQTSDGGFILLGRTNSEGAGGYDFYLVKTDKDGNAQ